MATAEQDVARAHTSEEAERRHCIAPTSGRSVSLPRSWAPRVGFDSLDPDGSGLVLSCLSMFPA